MAAFSMKEVRYMIIYISSKEKEGLLDRMAEQYEWDLLTEVMEKGSLNTFIPERLQIIHDLRYVVIERSCIKDNSQQLRDMMETTRTMWDTQFILLEEEYPQDDEGEYQKVIYRDHITILYKYQDNLESSLEYLLKGEKIPIEDVYNGTWIGIMSSNSGAGATHISIGLANFIHKYTENVCYVEANESGDLAAMADFYGFEKIEDNHYRRNGMDYRHMDIDQEKRFVILDMGKYTTAKLNLFNQCKIKIVITDGKPYRMADALNVLRYAGENVRLWMNFCQAEEYERLKEMYLSECDECGCISGHKDMFQGTDPLYHEVMKGYLNVSTKKTPGISFLLNGERLKTKRKSVPKAVSSGQSAPETADKVTNIEPRDIEIQEDYSEPEEQKTEEQTVSSGAEEQKELPEESFMEDNSVEEEKVPDKTKIKIPVKTMTFFLVLVLSLTGAVAISKIKPDGFSFNIPNTEQTTELVDEELNINPDIRISVQEVEGADGYEVSYSTDKNFDKKTTVIVEVETADKAVESLTAGRTYYVRVRAFRFNEDGTKIYGEYTEVEKIET